MSLSLADHHQPVREVGGSEGLVPPHLTAEDLIGHYSASFPSPDSSFDEDRPQSRLTIIESPTTDDYDYYDEFSQFSLDSPDPEEEQCDSPSGIVSIFNLNSISILISILICLFSLRHVELGARSYLRRV